MARRVPLAKYRICAALLLLAFAVWLVSVAQDVPARAESTATRNGPSLPFDCAQIAVKGINKQMNMRASTILEGCSQHAASTHSTRSWLAVTGQWGQTLNHASSDVDLITGGEIFPHVTQAESFVWAQGDTVVVNYNDSRDRASIGNSSGVSYSTDGGSSFTRMLPSPLGTGHGSNFGDPIVVYNRALGLWFAGDLVSGCGGAGIGLWTSTDGVNWNVGSCAHVGANDDRESMWVDNTPASPHYGRMYVAFNNFDANGGALQIVRSDDGVNWSAPVTTFPYFVREVQATGGPDGTVFVAACDEEGGGINPRTHYMRRSTNGGVTWTYSVMVIDAPAPGDTTCPAPNDYFNKIQPIWRYMGWGQPGVGPGGVVHYAYTAHGEGTDEADIFYVRSTDNGLTWSDPIKLNTDSTNREQWMPSLSVTTWGAVTVSWYDRRNTTDGTNYQYWSRISLDNGATWQPDQPTSDVLIPQPAQPDPNFSDCYAGDYNYHYASSETAYLTWTDGRVQVNGTNQQDVFFDKIALPQGGTATVTPTLTNTPTATATSNPATILVGHVTWQGPPSQPHARQQLPVTLTLKLGNSEVNYPTQNTDASGFFTVSVTTLPNGVYAWRAKGPRYLATSGTITLTGAPTTQQEMGVQLAGDANDSNVVNAQDFTILRSAFGGSTDLRADFNNDGVVNSSDFNLLRDNFGQSGAPPVGPVRR